MNKYNVGDILKFNNQAIRDVHEHGMITKVVSNVYHIYFLESSQEHQYYIDYIDTSKHIWLAA